MIAGSDPFSREGVFTAADLRRRASRRLPRFVFDFVDGGADREAALRRNVDAFDRCVLVPRIGNGVAVTPGCELFGHRYAAPIGIAPIGLADLVAPGADLVLARAAAAANLPYIASAAAGMSIATIARAMGTPPWFQLYMPRNPAMADTLINSAVSVGVEVLVVTIDTPVPGKRVRDLRNGLTLPLRPTLRMLADSARAPHWALKRLRAGPIRFANFETAASPPELPFHQVMAEQVGGTLDWDALARLRARWPHLMVIKGVMAISDAERASALGIDGIIVSNHGGRQLDAAPAPLDVFPATRAALPNAVLMLDSGVRSGSDVARSVSVGADCVFLGRPFLWALAAFGSDGPATLAVQLIEEWQATLRLCGASCMHELAEVRRADRRNGTLRLSHGGEHENTR